MIGKGEDVKSSVFDLSRRSFVAETYGIENVDKDPQTDLSNLVLRVKTVRNERRLSARRKVDCERHVCRL